MPATMPGIVAKGNIAHKLEDALNDTSVNGKRKQLYDRLLDKIDPETYKESLLAIASDDALVGIRPIDKRHLERDWFDREGGYWATFQPIEPVLRHGLIQAIELANQPGEDGNPKKIDILWICAGHHFEVTSCASTRQVTILVLTPPLPISDRLPEDYTDYVNTEPIYVVRHHGRGPGEHEYKLPADFVEFVQPRSL